MSFFLLDLAGPFKEQNEFAFDTGLSSIIIVTRPFSDGFSFFQYLRHSDLNVGVCRRYLSRTGYPVWTFCGHKKKTSMSLFLCLVKRSGTAIIIHMDGYIILISFDDKHDGSLWPGIHSQ